MRLRPRSIRLRLTLWYATALTLIIVAFSTAVYLGVRRSLLAQAEAQIEKDLGVLRRAIAEDLEEVEEVGEHGSVEFFRVSDGGGRVAYETPGWRRAGIDPDRAEAGPGPLAHWHGPAGRTFLLRTEGVVPRSPLGVAEGRPLRVTVAADREPVERSLHVLLVTLLVGAPCAAAAAVAGGYFLAGRALAPIGAMAQRAARISADNLGERLPVENPDDEVGQLAAVFNEGLARIERSFDRLRRFTTDASHQLRTPLAAIRSVGEVALGGGGDVGAAAAHREAIGSILEEVDRLARLVDSLLVLTRGGDLARPYLRPERIDLVPLARDVAELLRPLAEEKGQTLSFEDGGPVLAEADRATLRQALVNILDNAIKYTPAGGRVRVAVRRGESGAPLIEVADTGPGIAREHHDRIFDRFYRLDEAGQPAGGTGLGLAIARWAVELNGGRIELESELGRGSTFRLILQPGR